MKAIDFVCKTLFWAMPAFVVASCASDQKDISVGEWEELVIESYFYENYPNDPINSFGSVSNEGGYILKHTIAGGETPRIGDFVKFEVVGKLLNGNKFKVTTKREAELLFAPSAYLYSTHYVPDYDSLGSTAIPAGVTDMLVNMGKGDSVTILLPSVRAYGEKTYAQTGYTTTVPANTPVIFELVLREVIHNPKEYELAKIEEYRNDHAGFVNVYENDTARIPVPLTGIYIKYVDTLAVTDTTPLPQKDTVLYLKYAGYYLDGFVLDTNIDSIARAQLKSFFTVQSKYSTTFNHTLGSGTTTTIAAFDAALRKLTKGSTVEFIFTSDWGYGQYGNTNVQPYTPLRFRVYREK
jgi:FKBP-type peptidyl-prolyl cis-trans isomerase